MWLNNIPTRPNPTMSESEEADNTDSTIDISELSGEQVEALSSHPEVRKMLHYEESDIPDIAEMLENMTEAEEGTDEGESYDLLVSGIAERSGRITESTVAKVLTGLVEEYNDVK